MNKLLLPLLAISLLANPLTAQALDISVKPDGSVEIYSDSVLGMDSENEDELTESPEKVIPAINKQQIRIKPAQDTLRVETIRRSGPSQEVMETRETDRVRVDLPARQTEEQRRLEMAKLRATKSDTSVVELERQVDKQSEERMLELSKLTPEQREKRKLFYEEQKEERQERMEERLELKNSYGPDGQELSIGSRGIRAAMGNSQVTIDPETNSLILTTKDGEERVLTTLPDRAIERMKELRGIDSIDTDSVQLRERDGRIEYSTKAQRTKRLFGMFQRTVDTELIVDDQTGEASERVGEKPTLIGRFLDRLSF